MREKDVFFQLQLNIRFVCISVALCGYGTVLKSARFGYAKRQDTHSWIWNASWQPYGHCRYCVIRCYGAISVLLASFKCISEPSLQTRPICHYIHSYTLVCLFLSYCTYVAPTGVLTVCYPSVMFRHCFSVQSSLCLKKKRPRQLYQWMLFSAIRWSQSWERSLVVKTIWNQNRTTKKWFKIKSSPEWFKSRLNRIILNHYQDWFVVGTTVVYWHLYGLFSQ